MPIPYDPDESWAEQARTEFFEANPSPAEVVNSAVLAALLSIQSAVDNLDVEVDVYTPTDGATVDMEAFSETDYLSLIARQFEIEASDVADRIEKGDLSS